MGVQAGDREVRVGQPETAQRAIGQAQGPKHVPAGDLGDGFAQGDVARDEHHPEFVVGHEHREIVRAGQVSQNLGVPRKRDAGGVQRRFVDRCRDQGAHLPSQRGTRGGDDRGVGGTPRRRRHAPES